VRIIGGTHRGQKLIVPRGLVVRPTSDRVKEALFNILGPLVTEADVLDLFAGTGNLALESLSRGAARATCVESNRRALQAIRANIQNTGLGDKIVVLPRTVHSALSLLARKGRSFDIVFMDPPYRKGLVAPTVLEVLEKQLLLPGGVIAIEHAPDESATECSMDGVMEWKSRTYGDTALTILSCGSSGQ